MSNTTEQKTTLSPAEQYRAAQRAKRMRAVECSSSERRKRQERWIARNNGGCDAAVELMRLRMRLYSGD